MIIVENNSQTRKQRSKGNKKKQPTKTNKKRTSLLKKILLGVLLLGVAVFVFGAGLFTYYASKAPEVNKAALVDTAPSEILDRNGDVVLEVGAGSQNRDLVNTDEIPPLLKDAVTSIEDQRFYKHIGVDPIRILGAALANVQKGGISQGGSTITQQLIKLSFFGTSEEDQTLERKAQEAWMSIKLERELSKEDILGLYINKVYMGNNVYGMGTAAEYYFGKDLSEISLDEAATLAGMPQAPSYYDPYVNPTETEERRNVVLTTMVDTGVITEAQRAEARAVSVADNLVDHSNDTDNSLILDSYLQVVMDEVYDKTGLEVEVGGLTIQTNLDMDAQQHLFDIANSDEYVLFPDDRVQTAVTLVDVHSGAINAVIGNRKKTNLLAINYADQTTRSVASTIKPLIDYAPAIEYNNLSTGSLIVDEEYTYPDGNSLENYDLLYRGDLTLREALVDSRNVPAAKLLNDIVGIDNADAFLNKLGIDSVQADGSDTINPSNAIQGSISNIQMAAAYAAFSNGGTYYEPYTVQSVTKADGQVLEFSENGSRAMKDSTAYMMTDMLKDVVTEQAPIAAIPGLPQAAKTGTEAFTEEELALVGASSGDNVAKDSWFVGYSPNYSIAVWMGYEDETESGNYLTFEERDLTRYIYRELMSFVSQGIENPDWIKPESVVEATMEKYSNPPAKPGPNTPANLRITELFVKGTAPTSVSKVYGESIQAPTGLNATYNQETNRLTVTWDKYQLAASEKRTPQYSITVGNESRNITENRITIDNPPKGNISISLLVKVGETTSPATSIQVFIEEPIEREETVEPEATQPESEEENKTESESSSSSSSSSESQEEEELESEEVTPDESVESRPSEEEQEEEPESEEETENSESE